MGYALVRVNLLDIEAFASATGLHRDLVRRLVTLGLLEPSLGPAGELRFARSQIAAAARLQRLRTGLALNYAALGVVTALIDRIAELEAEVRARPRREEGRQWTRAG